MNEFDKKIRALIERGEPIDHHIGGDFDIETGSNMESKDPDKQSENVTIDGDIAEEANTGGNNPQR